MPRVLVALAVAVELVEHVGHRARDLVGEPRLADEQRRVEGWPGLATRPDWPGTLR